MADQNAQVAVNSLGTSVNTTNWVAAVAMCLVVISKLSCKWTRTRTIQVEDFCMLIAMLVGLGESVAVSQEVSQGLGQHEITLTVDQALHYQKPYYAAQILYVAAICIAKLGMASILAKMRMLPQWVIASGIIVGLSISWACAVMSALAIRCVSDNKWTEQPMACTDEITIWKASGIVDIGTDVLLVALAAIIVGKAQAPLLTRISIILAFGAKLICIPLIVLRIIFIDDAIASKDGTYAGAKSAIASQLAMNLSIMTTCVPYLKSFLSRMDHGTFTNDYRLKSPRQKAYDTLARTTPLPPPPPPPTATHLQGIQSPHIAAQAHRQRLVGGGAAVPPARPNRGGEKQTTSPATSSDERRRQRKIRRRPLPLPVSRVNSLDEKAAESYPRVARKTGLTSATAPWSTGIVDEKYLPKMLKISPGVPSGLTESRWSASYHDERSPVSRSDSPTLSEQHAIAASHKQASRLDVERQPPMSLTNTLTVLGQMRADEQGNRSSPLRSWRDMPIMGGKSSTTLTQHNALQSKVPEIDTEPNGIPTPSSKSRSQPTLVRLPTVLEVSPVCSDRENIPASLRRSPAVRLKPQVPTFLDTTSSGGSQQQTSSGGSQKQTSSSDSQGQDALYPQSKRERFPNGIVQKPSRQLSEFTPNATSQPHYIAQLQSKPSHPTPFLYTPSPPTSDTADTSHDAQRLTTASSDATQHTAHSYLAVSPQPKPEAAHAADDQYLQVPALFHNSPRKSSVSPPHSNLQSVSPISNGHAPESAAHAPYPGSRHTRDVSSASTISSIPTALPVYYPPPQAQPTPDPTEVSETALPQAPSRSYTPIRFDPPPRLYPSPNNNATHSSTSGSAENGKQKSRIRRRPSPLPLHINPLPTRWAGHVQNDIGTRQDSRQGGVRRHPSSHYTQDSARTIRPHAHLYHTSSTNTSARGSAAKSPSASSISSPFRMVIRKWTTFGVDRESVGARSVEDGNADASAHRHQSRVRGPNPRNYGF